MLKDIKALYYFSEKLFNLMEEGQKLKLIKYNKSLQNNLNINFLNFKYFSKRYIIYESNRKGKEFNANDDSLLFEGEYINGERNGKGKEYDKDEKLVYEGEYLKGKRNGKGKEYY